MRRKTLTKPKNEIWLKGVCVSKSVNKKGMFPNPMLHKLYPRIFTQEGYIVTSTFFLDREVWLTKDLTKEEKWVYWHWVRDNYAKFDRINGDLHPYIQSECVKINNQHLRNTAKNNSAL